MLQQAVNFFNEGKTEEAEYLFREILKTQPKNIEANHFLGILLQTLGKLDEAEASYKKTIELKPNHAEAYQYLGDTLIQLLKFEEAELIYKKALELNPWNVRIHFNLSATLNDLNKLDEAEASYKKTIELKPNYAEAYNGLARVYISSLKFEEAETSYQKALEFKPNYAEAYNGLGGLYVDLGKFKEAETSYKKSIELKSDYTSSYRILANLKKLSKEDDLFITMQNLYSNKNLNNKKRIQLCFALAKIYEDISQFDESFRYYAEGNELQRKLLNYNMDYDNQTFDQLKKAHPSIKKNFLRTNEKFNKPKIIFIVGMPRSGTTLIEQIISSHSEVQGVGELKYVPIFGDHIARGISKINRKTIENFRKKYFKKIKDLSDGSLMLTDKMTLNFRYIGLICAAFPEAKIIHVKRNQAATCWGIYKQYFSQNNLTFSYSLDDIKNFYKLYLDLMKFWGECYNDHIYNIEYEKLTINQDYEIRKLISYLGLKWENDCLTPENNKRKVSTSSVLQVRKKIYQNSSQEWKNFEPYLKGIFNHLDNI